MALGVYCYYDDGNRSYQIILPDDFAAALGYAAADPDDPYLPDGLSPRYASYVSPSNKLFREVIVTSRSVFVAPPQQVSADGYVWELASLYGERYMMLPGGNVRVISGVPGPPGQDAEISATTRTWGSSSMGAGFQSVLGTWTALAAGTYFFSGFCVITSGAVATELQLQLQNDTDGIMIARASQRAATVSVKYTIPLSVLFTIAAPKTIALRSGNSAGTSTVQASNVSIPEGAATLIKIA